MGRNFIHSCFTVPQFRSIQNPVVVIKGHVDDEFIINIRLRFILSLHNTYQKSNMMATTRATPSGSRFGIQVKGPLATYQATGRTKSHWKRNYSDTRSQSLPEMALFLADAAPGTVEAPPVAIIVAAIGVSAGVLAIPFLLKPGIDAAEKMQERDAKSGRWRK